MNAGFSRQRSRNRSWGLPVLAAVLIIAALRVAHPRERERETAQVTRDSFHKWTVYEGRLEARDIRPIASPISGEATIAELIPEGSEVKKGVLLVRFDDTAISNEVVRLRKDRDLALLERDSLVNATLPMELGNLTIEAEQSRAEHMAEKLFLDDCIKLMDEQLMSPADVEQQRARVRQTWLRFTNLTEQVRLATTYLHPARKDRAAATLTAAQRALDTALRQLDGCTVLSPSDGRVVYLPLNIGQEYRTARVGDRLYRNQEFLAIQDMNHLVGRCLLPESELALVRVGCEAVLIPLAFPNLQLNGTVESVSEMAQSVPDRASWEKFFRVQIRVTQDRGELGQADQRLRSGLSVQIRILSERLDSAVLVPRAAVSWENGQAVCEVQRGLRWMRQPLTLGSANYSHYVVTRGLSPGEKVLIP